MSSPLMYDQGPQQALTMQTFEYGPCLESSGNSVTIMSFSMTGKNSANDYLQSCIPGPGERPGICCCLCCCHKTCGFCWVQLQIPG